MLETSLIDAPGASRPRATTRYFVSAWAPSVRLPVNTCEASLPSVMVPISVLSSTATVMRRGGASSAADCVPFGGGRSPLPSGTIVTTYSGSPSCERGTDTVNEFDPRGTPSFDVTTVLNPGPPGKSAARVIVSVAAIELPEQIVGIAQNGSTRPLIVTGATSGRSPRLPSVGSTCIARSTEVRSARSAGGASTAAKSPAGGPPQ